MTHTESLFEIHPDPIVAYQPTEPPIVTALNAAFARQFDLSTSLVDQPLAETLSAIGIDDHQPVSTDSDADSDSSGDHSANEATAADGRVYTLRTVEGKASSYLLLTDVSSYTAQKEVLETEKDRLEQFARTLSHDLRNPLEVAQSRLVAAQETGDAVHFEKVAAAHTRIRELIGDMLTLAKSGATISDTEPTAIASVANQAWASVDTEGVTLTVDADLGTIEADPERLRTVFENLFRNSIEHGMADDQTESDGTVTHADPALSIAIESINGGFAVADSGSGIPADRRDAVFEAGVSTGNGTTGLGLSIVAEIAAAHGWQLTLTESQTGGAQFEFQT